MPSNWQKNERGEVMLCPLAGSGIEQAAGMFLAVRLVFWRQQDPFDQPPEGSVQLAMSPAIARQFAQQLMQEADRIEQLPPPPGPPN